MLLRFSYSRLSVPNEVVVPMQPPLSAFLQ